MIGRRPRAVERIGGQVSEAAQEGARGGVRVRDDLRIRPTRLEAALDWAQSLAPSPLRLASGCCGMAIASGGDPFEALGAGPPAVSARAADLLIVAGSISHRAVPLLEATYERMLEPRWVVAWGACAISGGAYRNYATVHGLSRIVPVDVVVPGCPPPVTALRDVLEALRSGDVRKQRGDLLQSRDPAEWPILREAGSPPVTDHPEATAVPDRADPERATAAEAASEGNQDVGLG